MRVTLDEACVSIADGDHQAPPKSADGIPFITISCLDPDGGKPDFDSAARVPLEYYESLADNRCAKAGDVLLSVVGSLGIPYLVKEDDQFVFQRHIAILRPGQGLLPEYLYYLLKSPESFHYIDSVAQGAAQRTLTLTQLRAMEVDIPPLDEQRRRISALEPYDNLIENNRRQIALLEEAAQRLYKEWFVDLHFPGHERAEIINGVPRGWNNVSVNELFEYHDSKRIPLSGAEREKIQGTYPYYGAAACLDYVNDYLFDGIYLLLGEDGTVITDEGTPMLQYVWGKLWVNNHAHILTGNEPFTTEYLFCMFRNMYIGDVVTGAAQPKVSQKRLNTKTTLRPDSDLVRRFCKVIAPMFDRIRCLKKQADDTREARDRLLPKLMSGEIGM